MQNRCLEIEVEIVKSIDQLLDYPDFLIIRVACA